MAGSSSLLTDVSAVCSSGRFTHTCVVPNHVRSGRPGVRLRLSLRAPLSESAPRPSPGDAPRPIRKRIPPRGTFQEGRPAGWAGWLGAAVSPPLVLLRPEERMAQGLESLERCLPQYLPADELREVKRILYGANVRFVGRTTDPGSLCEEDGGGWAVPAEFAV